MSVLWEGSKQKDMFETLNWLAHYLGECDSNWYIYRITDIHLSTWFYILTDIPGCRSSSFSLSVKDISVITWWNIYMCIPIILHSLAVPHKFLPLSFTFMVCQIKFKSIFMKSTTLYNNNDAEDLHWEQIRVSIIGSVKDFIRSIPDRQVIRPRYL